jgi:hypothetical protein
MDKMPQWRRYFLANNLQLHIFGKATSKTAGKASASREQPCWNALARARETTDDAVTAWGAARCAAEIKPTEPVWVMPA